MRLLFVALAIVSALAAAPPTGRLPGPVQTNPAYIDFAYQPVLPKVPGIDFLGWGYDATFRDTFYALKPLLFLYSYDNNPKGSEMSYTYPTDTTAYAVPDQVYVRAVGKTVAKTEISDSTQMQRMRIDLRLNLALSTTQFSGALNFGLDIVQTSDVHTRICSCWAEVELFQLYLGTRYLSADVQNAFNTVFQNGAYSPNNAVIKAAYSLFLSQWGTHFVDSVTVGGSLAQITQFNNVTSTNLLELTVALSGKFSSGSTTFSGNLSFGFSQAQIQIQTQTTASAYIYGGDAKFTDYLLKSDDPASANQLYTSWKATLLKNPVAVRYRLVETWQLAAVDLNNPAMATSMCTAIQDYLGWSAEAPTYCSGVPAVLSYYVNDGGILKGDTATP